METLHSDPLVPRPKRRTNAKFVCFFSLMTAAQLVAVTLEELQQDPKLTPKQFAKHFTEFAYAEHSEVQDPEIFLLTKSGDCDDYAILADMVLRPKGYDTRLISVRMPGIVVHVVCYVTQEKGYLDYNNRVHWSKIERSGPSLREIARNVARSFSANWTSASEFAYLGDSRKRLIATVAKTDPRGTDGSAAKSSKTISIDF